jgi:hypothetical protein
MKTEFEKQLEGQPLRELPREWRSKILAAASGAPRSMPAEWLSSWLWPHPRAWTGLAAAWIVIFLLHLTAPDEAGAARNSSPMRFESFAKMREQTVLMAQLLGSLDDGDPPAAATTAPPKPRSEGPRRQLIG